MQAKIHSVETKPMNTDGRDWTNHIVTFDSELKIFSPEGEQHPFKKASTNDIAVESLKLGDMIDAEFTLKGKYVNIKSFKVTGIGTVTPQEKTIPAPQHPNAPFTPEPKNDNAYWEKKQATERESIERQKAAAIAFEHSDCLMPTNDVKTYLGIAEAIYQWIHTGAMPSTSKSIDTPKQEPKPATTQPEGKASVPIMDTGMLLNSIKHRLKFTTDKAATQWLLQQNDIPAERIENEPGAVYAEMKEKYHWI